MPSPDLSWQPTLFDTQAPGFDETFSTLERIDLDPTAWVDYAPEWVSGSDELFAQVLEEREWGQRSRRMYDGRVVEPRLTAPWNARSGEELRPPVLEDIRVALSEHYGIEFDSVGFNLYRDGRDSVAWHGDHIKEEIEEPLVALVSLGEPRRFLLRPKGGGKSRAFMLGRGDLLVTGGKTQRTWEHSVPKVAQAGPRISLAYRHGLDPRAYAHKRQEGRP
ncbi:MAG TPA: alpha-ketoglutarate-dependent dioxygenase AlkB [Actinomycetota bacterium]|nr:alpha-ketoglutarate-dependent dioxygenase AlkB [Actinomycetota bacterium]